MSQSSVLTIDHRAEEIAPSASATGWIGEVRAVSRRAGSAQGAGTDFVVGDDPMTGADRNRRDRELGVPVAHVERDDEEYVALVAIQAKLAVRELEGELTTSERRQLELVRWTIDQIEMAQAAEHLGFLRQLAELQEKLAEDVSRFVAAAGASR